MKNRKIAIISASAIAISSPLSGLFMESYLVQYLLTPLLYLNIFLALPILRALEKNAKTSFWTLLPFAMMSTMVWLLYPYFALVPIVIITISLWLVRGNVYLRLKYLIYFVALCLALGNVGYIFLMNPGATGQFVAALNGIARWVVFPFYDKPRFMAIVLGLAPFHADIDLLRSISREWVKLPGFSGYLEYLSFLYSKASLIVYGVIIACCGTIFMRMRKTLSPIGYGSWGAVIYPVVACAALLFSGLYAYCKLVWTFATLLPLIIAPVLAIGARPVADAVYSIKYRKIIYSVSCAFMLVIYIFGNAISKVATPMLWLANPNGEIANRYNTAAASDIVLLGAWLHQHDGLRKTYAFSDSAGVTCLHRNSNRFSRLMHLR